MIIILRIGLLCISCIKLLHQVLHHCIYKNNYSTLIWTKRTQSKYNVTPWSLAGSCSRGGWVIWSSECCSAVRGLSVDGTLTVWISSSAVGKGASQSIPCNSVDSYNIITYIIIIVSCLIVVLKPMLPTVRVVI